MTTKFEDELWDHLVHEHHADTVQFGANRGRRQRSRARLAVLSSGIAAAIAAIAVPLTVLGTATPAYAYTQNSDGTATVSLHDIATGVPALNALFKEHGIEAVVIPVTSDCAAATPLILFPGPDQSAQTVTIGNKWIPAGYEGVLAAQELPDGRVALAMGSMRPPAPECVRAISATSPRGTVIAPTPVAGSSGTPAGSSGAALPAGSSGVPAGSSGTATPAGSSGVPVGSSGTAPVTP